MGTATTFTELIAAPESEKVFLCEVKPGELVTNFTLTAGKTYTYELAYPNETVTLADGTTETIRKAVAACELDGAALTDKDQEPGVTLTYAASGSSGITVADDPDIDFGTGNFTLVWRGSLPDWTPVQTNIFGKYSAGGEGYALWMQDANPGILKVYVHTTNYVSTVTHSITDGVVAEIAAVVIRETASVAGSVTIYVDGVQLGEVVVIGAAAPDSVDNTDPLYVCGERSGIRYASTTQFAATFNRALTAAEVLDLYRNGINYADKWGSQTVLTSGTLTVGKRYRIDDWITDDDFTNVGGANVDGTEFVATGTTPTHWAHSSTVRETGVTLALEPEGITLADWQDSSTNNLDATYPVAGCTPVEHPINLVETNAGSYWHDTDDSLLYVHPPDDGSPNHHTVIAYFWVYFATKGIVLNSQYYEPYIAQNGIPSISQESQSIHWGASQISSGAVVLLNSRGYFDQIAKRWIWNNKDIRILLGGDALAYAEYTSLFAGKIMQADYTKTDFTVSIQSKAFALLRKLPINNFWTSTWANLHASAEGKPIPYYWGSYNAAQAPIVTCINTAYGASQYQFKICDCTFHAIKSITQVYIDYGAGAGWQTIAHANEDLANGTFTITAASFVLGTSRVKVAFEGYHSGGVLIDGAPELVEDLLLNQCGYAVADLNAASFTASREISSCSLNVAIETETSTLSIIETVCQSDLAFFDEDGSGSLRYRSWSPAISATAPVVAKEDILAPPQIIDDTSKLFWKVRVGYSWQGALNEYLYTEASHDPSKYKYGRKDSLDFKTYLRSKADADELAGRLNWITRNPSPIISMQLKAGMIDKLLGDRMWVTLARAPFGTVGGYDEREFEIISKDVSCFPLFVTLRGRDAMEFGADVGFWMGDSAPAWAAATAQEKEDSGFWADDNGLCLTADAASLNKSLWW
jgi:hypothetical protein